MTLRIGKAHFRARWKSALRPGWAIYPDPIFNAHAGLVHVGAYLYRLELSFAWRVRP